MRQRGIVLSQFGAERVESFFWLTITADKAKRPVRDFLITRVPFVCPREKDGTGETAMHHAVDMPAEHFRLLVFGMTDGVHPEFAEDERPVFGQVLQAQQIAFKIALVMQV